MPSAHGGGAAEPEPVPAAGVLGAGSVDGAPRGNEPEPAAGPEPEPGASAFAQLYEALASCEEGDQEPLQGFVRAHGPNTDVTVLDHEGAAAAGDNRGSPLLIACELDLPAAAAALLGLGADPNYRHPSMIPRQRAGAALRRGGLRGHAARAAWRAFAAAWRDADPRVQGGHGTGLSSRSSRPGGRPRYCWRHSTAEARRSRCC